jgi:hypothetical protein
MAIMCIGPRFSGQLQVHAPRLAAAQTGDVITVPFQVAGRLNVHRALEPDAPDLELTAVARAEADSTAYVLALSVNKTT